MPFRPKSRVLENREDRSCRVVGRHRIIPPGEGFQLAKGRVGFPGIPANENGRSDPVTIHPEILRTADRRNQFRHRVGEESQPHRRLCRVRRQTPGKPCPRTASVVFQPGIRPVPAIAAERYWRPSDCDSTHEERQYLRAMPCSVTRASNQNARHLLTGRNTGTTLYSGRLRPSWEDGLATSGQTGKPPHSVSRMPGVRQGCVWHRILPVLVSSGFVQDPDGRREPAG